MPVSELALEPLWVSVPKSHLDQILINLVVNSREAKATSIRIQATLAAWSKLDKPPQLRLQVLDNGTGFTASALKHAPDEYFTEDSSVGTGIGLATVERLLRQSKGSLVLENRHEQGGAVATMEIPLQSAGER